MTTNKRGMTGEEMEAQVVAKIGQFSPENIKSAEQMHALIKRVAPELKARLWYGMPGYAKTKDSAVLLFFREDKYMTFGLTEAVEFAPEPGAATQLMPCAWFFSELDQPTEKAIEQIVLKAIA